LKYIALDLSLNNLIMIYGDQKKIYYKKSIPLLKDRAGIMFANLENMINDLKVDIDSLDILFSTIGPGNFNGIRVSLSLIKGMAITNNVRIAGLSSLELLSRSFINKHNQNICTIIKASPGFYYLEIFNQFYNSILAPRLININEDIKLPMLNNEMVLVGNEVEIVSKAIKFKGEIKNISIPTPKNLYCIVQDKINKNNFLDANPQYLREVNAGKPSSWKRNPLVK